MDYITITAHIQQILTGDQASYYSIIPKQITESSLELYVDKTKDYELTSEELEMLFNRRIIFCPVDSALIQKTISKYYRKTKETDGDNLLDHNDFKSKDFLHNLVIEAINVRSSDIHIEIYENLCRVRMRVDGLLIERFVLKKTEYPSIVNKIKVQANLDISEKRLPQDGRIFYNSGREKFDIRVSILPTMHGEKIVLRLLTKTHQVLTLRI